MEASSLRIPSMRDSDNCSKRSVDMEDLYKHADRSSIRHLFHDCGYIYISNIEPEEAEPVTVRLRAEKGNVTWAYVEFSHDGSNWTSCRMQREKEDETGYFEYFIGTIPGQREMFKYRFRVGNELPENEVYYSRTRIGKEAPVFDESKGMEPDDCWTILPGFHTPDWAKGIIWYSIMPDAFYNGDITNDEPVSGENLSNPWNMAQHNLKYKYGGDLKGIEKKLDYIRALGCEAVFMDPIFKSSQNAGYGPEFYKQIENSFGNREALADLARAVHEKGMYYMIDVVLTFVAVRDIWYNGGGTNPYPGAAQEWDSPYHEFFYFNGEEGDTRSYASNWGGLTLNFASERLRDLIYRKKDSYLQYYCSAPFSPDAVRFDCGGAISGTYPDGSTVRDYDVVGEIRSYLRAINPEVMLLSEYSFYPSIDKGAWDARWNLEFVKYGLMYMRGEIAESFLFDRFDKEIRNVPRAFALCQYNSMADHDRPRITGVEPYAFRAFQLIHMTQIGAPCIYYGDEIRIEREKDTFYAMEWNEANWDYAVLNDTRALTELRKRFSALRCGMIQYLCVDDENHIIAFARKDAASTVITVASRNPMQREFAVDTRELGEVDGTVFTDWFTGRTYTAKDGYLDVMLPAGGTIFVKGRVSADFKGGFAIEHTDPAAEDCAANVTVPCDGAIRIKGSGIFVHRDIFNTCEISAVCKCGEGVGMLVLCGKETDTPAFIGAAVDQDFVTVYVRETAGKKVRKAVSRRIAKNSYIKIVRKWDNSYDVYATRVPGSIWDEILCNVHVDIPNHASAGMTVLEGTAEFSDIRVKYEKKSILWDDFKHGNTAMFDFAPDRKLRYRKDGLALYPENGGVQMLTNGMDEDWTFQTEVKFRGGKEGDYAGIVSRQDEDIYVAAGRMVLQGKQVFFIGRASVGKLVVYHTAEDTMPGRRALVQLQRIGTTYSAVYSYDGINWKQVGRNVIANLCAERVGLTVWGDSSAVFGFASFGDAVHDGASFHTPHTPGLQRPGFGRMKDALTEPAYRIVSGQWEYDDEGYFQTSMEQAQMGISNKVYTDFMVTGTYAIDKGCGFVGFEFGKKAYDSPLGDGILVRIGSDGSLRLVKAGEAIAECELPVGGSKLSVENRNGVLVVSAGQEGEPVLVLRDFEQTKGYISYFTEGVTAHVNNSLAASYDADYYVCCDYETPEFTENTAEKRWTHTHGFLNPFGMGVTDFVLSAKFKVKEFSGNPEEAYAGFYLCSPEGKFDDAVAVVFDRRNRLLLKCGGQVAANASLEGKKSCTELMVVRKGERIAVYADGSKTPLLDYTGITRNGGTVTFCANKSAVVFERPKLKELNITEQPEDTVIYKAWMRRK